MKNPIKEKGDSRLFFVFSLVAGIFNILWFGIYTVCLFLRTQVFNTAQTNMMLSGQSTYTVEVTSPLFGVLKVLAYVIPVIITVWTVLLLVNDKKGRHLCDKWIIGSVFGAQLISALLVTADITMWHMVF